MLEYGFFFCILTDGSANSVQFHTTVYKDSIIIIIIIIYYNFLWLCSPARAMASSSTRFRVHT
jgi:hypothetical protein